MSIQSKINRLSTNVSGALEEIAAKGVNVPAGSNSDSLRALIHSIQTGGGLPSGLSAIKYGEIQITTDIQSASSSSTGTTYQRTFTHGLGVKPDLIILYHEGNIATTYSELLTIYSSGFLEYRSGYGTPSLYHSNSTTSVSGGSVSSTYGIKNVNANTFDLRTHSSSQYFWRAGTYKYIAIKFG